MDISSEMIHGLLPVFLMTTLGAGAMALGLIEGLAEAVAALLKIVSGGLSDKLARRKPLLVMGYGLGAFAKPLFALATAASGVLAARLIDRVGKGMRGAPRDALIADIVAPPRRGAAYGLRQALDTVGAFIGPLAAMGLMLLWQDDVRAVLRVAILPGLLAVLVLVVLVREPRRAPPKSRAAPVDWRAWRRLGRPFWRVLGLASMVAFARLSDAFLILAALHAGLADAFSPLVLVVMNVVFAALSYPVGALSDRVGRKGLMALGLVMLIAAALSLAAAHSLPLVLLGVCLWGLHMGLTQGLFAAMVADSAAPPQRGLAFGLFHGVTALALLAGNLAAGALWQFWSPGAVWLLSALIAGVALVGLTARKFF